MRNGVWYPFLTKENETAYANSVTGEVAWGVPAAGRGSYVKKVNIF